MLYLKQWKWRACRAGERAPRAGTCALHAGGKTKSDLSSTAWSPGHQQERPCQHSSRSSTCKLPGVAPKQKQTQMLNIIESPGNLTEINLWELDHPKERSLTMEILMRVWNKMQFTYIADRDVKCYSQW